jgi:C-terminal region of peptidase_M24
MLTLYTTSIICVHVRVCVDVLGEYGGRGFLGFEKLTMIPIQRKLIDVSLLLPAEVQWYNDYHAEVYAKVYPLLKTDRARSWLKENTRPLSGLLPTTAVSASTASASLSTKKPFVGF